MMRGSMTSTDNPPGGRVGQLSREQRRLALVFARAILPEGGRVLAGDERSVDVAARFARDISAGASEGFGALLQLLEYAAVMTTGRRFSRLDPERQDELLQRWQTHPILHRSLANALYDSWQLEEALLHYRETVRLNPMDLEARQNLASVERLLRAGIYDKARARSHEVALLLCARS